MANNNGSPPNHHVEILMNIEEADLMLLSDIYRDSEPNPYASSLLDNGLRIKEMVKGYPIRFMSPLGIWKENGTFIAVIEFDSCIEVGVFTLNPESKDPSDDSVFTALNFTKRINFESSKRPIVFKEFHPGLHHVLMRVIRGRHLQIDREEKFCIYKINKVEASLMEITVPEDLEVKPLDAIHAFAIQGNWPHPYPSSEDVPRTLLDVNGGYGIFKKSNDQLLSWGVKTMMGQMGYIQTIEDFQKNGYASIIVKTFAKEFASEGFHPIAIVGEHDTGSHAFFEKLGFRNAGMCNNIYLKKPGEGSKNLEVGQGSSRRSRSRSPKPKVI